MVPDIKWQPYCSVLCDRTIWVPLWLFVGVAQGQRATTHPKPRPEKSKRVHQMSLLHAYHMKQDRLHNLSGIPIFTEGSPKIMKLETRGPKNFMTPAERISKNRFLRHYLD